MKKVIFISSRTCSDKDKYAQYLLSRKNMVEEGYIYMENNNVAYFLDCVKKTAISYTEEQLNELYNQNVEICDLFLAIKDNKVSDEDIRLSIENNKQFFVANNIISVQEKRIFRHVYKLINNSTAQSINWGLYGVHEISRDIDNDSDMDKIRPQWCDKLIQYIFEHNDDVKEIHLILHEKDIPGYNDLTAQMIDGKADCREKGLISEETYRILSEKRLDLDITFFMHSNPCIMGVIGFYDEDFTKRIKTVEKKFDDALNYLRGIDAAKELANNLQTKREENKKSSST